MKSLLLIASTALAAVAAGAEPADAAGGKRLIFERDLRYEMAATHGADAVMVRGSHYKEIEAEVTVPEACTGLDGALLVAPAPPPPVPAGALLVKFSCVGAAEPERVGGLSSVYQGEDLPLALDFAGIGRARVHVRILGTPWT